MTIDALIEHLRALRETCSGHEFCVMSIGKGKKAVEFAPPYQSIMSRDTLRANYYDENIKLSAFEVIRFEEP